MILFNWKKKEEHSILYASQAKMMNDLSTSLTHFISLLLVVDLTEQWYLTDMVETLFMDFYACPEAEF